MDDYFETDSMLVVISHQPISIFSENLSLNPKQCLCLEMISVT